MTTVAITSTDIAADGMRTWGGEVRGLAHDKMRIDREENRIYAFTGPTPLFDRMVKWHKDGADAEMLSAKCTSEDLQWTLIVVDAEGIHKYSYSCPYKETFDPPIGFGAGGEIALGAMLAGKSAREAVEIVAGQCNHTGGKIQSINIASVVGDSPVAVAAE